jgi:hypothetical protein
MFTEKIDKRLFQALALIISLTLSGFSFAEDMCSDNLGSSGLPTVPGNYINQQIGLLIFILILIVHKK